MSNESGYIEKLNELVEAKKADNSVLETIKNNEKEYKKANENLEKLIKEIELLEIKLEEKKQVKSKTPFFKIKEFTQAVKELNEVKKELKQKLDEKTYLEEFCNEKLKQNEDIINEIDKQYIIFQENEIYIKSVEKITSNNIELSAEFYANYINHINKYMNFKYSIENNTKLIEPNVNDLAILLNIIQKNEEKQKTKKKTTTRKKSTKKESNGDTAAEEKKTTRKRSSKTENKEDVPAEEKKTPRKRASKTENQEEAPTEEKKTTRKRASKTENKEEAPAEEKKTTRNKTSKTENKQDVSVGDTKTTTNKKSTKK